MSCSTVVPPAGRPKRRKWLNPNPQGLHRKNVFAGGPTRPLRRARWYSSTPLETHPTRGQRTTTKAVVTTREEWVAHRGPSDGLLVARLGPMWTTRQTAPWLSVLEQKELTSVS